MKQWWEERPKGISKSERLSVRHCDAESRLRYITTVDSNRSYKLYEIDGQKAVYTKHKSDDPRKLERFISDECHHL